jgi:hypothetical protein
MSLTRRQLITRGLLASGALVVGGISVRYGPAFFSSPRPGLKVLTEKEHAIVIALLEAFFPKGSDMPEADLAYVIPNLDRHLTETHADMRLLFRAMLHVVEDHPLLFRFSRFTRLPLAERIEEVRAWETTPLYYKRIGFRSLKFLASIFYFEQPNVREAMGFYIGCQPAQLDGAV